ncbi:hypothetical protein NQ318_021818 [Aromia moschata]|uniref:Uncharacterized protein n=1 Tax=Aromia moschata TaxID=1265417 RepID=A0AAV8Z7U2_9CUCU|nr:hypothetical protein NQ318_021818 [Aromia moschata]
MVFELKDKVALITGGASGVGLRYAKELLRKGVKGATLADIDPQLGQTALTEIEKEFGANKAIFTKTDVTDIQQFEDAFKKTVETFGHIDILFNNAGILNDSIWQKQIAINMNGVIHGMLLGMEDYLQKYKQGSEAVIEFFGFIPIYSGTKSAVVAMTRNWGTPDHYQRTKVRVIAICPGVTHTPLIFDMAGRNLGEPYQQILDNNLSNIPSQEPEHLASEVVKLVTDGENGTIWVVEGGQPAYEFIIPERKIEGLSK